jgi:hypothetical protein
MAVCCQKLTLGAVSSRSALSMLVGALFKKFCLFLNTPCNNTKNSAYRSLVGPIRKYWVSCWDTYREGQINALDRVLKKASTFAKHTNDSAWETLAQRRKISCMCSHLQAYTGERAWKAIDYRLQGTCYLIRDDHDRKIRARKHRKDNGKYFF